VHSHTFHWKLQVDVIDRTSHFAGNTLCVTAAVFFFARLQLCEDFAAWADFAVRWNFETTYRTHFMRKCGAPPLLYIFAPHSAANFVGQDLF
jgi:hypothetical protein